MENSKPPSSCISPAAISSMSAGESSWAMHIANFLASPPYGRDEGMDQETASDDSFSSGFSSSFDSLDDDGDASFITSELMCCEEDESLQDTACSSAAATKITSSMENVDMKSKVTMDAKEFHMSQLARYSIDVGSQQQVTSVHQEPINSCDNNEKAIYECNELRKKGLCLVPISMLIDYLR